MQKIKPIISLTYRDKNRGLKLPIVLNEKLAEDIGIHIGDGCITRNNSGYEIYYSMNAIEDLDYSNFILGLKRNLFRIDFKTRIVKETEIRLVAYSKTIAKFYNQIFCLPLGRKTNITIPKIIESYPIFLKSCLRGIIDTDFSLSFKSREEKRNFYPVLMASFGYKNLMNSVTESLEKLGFTTNTCILKRYEKRYNKLTFGHQITLNGKKNIELWWHLIGSHNLRLIIRYLVWKKLGYLPPHTSIQERIKLLKK